MNFPVVIHKEKKFDYGVTVPDLPGCFSAGVTVDEALVMAKEAIELHLEGLIEEGQPVPEPRAIELLLHTPELTGGFFAMVSVDLSTLPLKAQRINITMPERVLASVDRFAERAGETRSGLLVKAATSYMQLQEMHAASARSGKERSKTRKR